MTTSDLTAQSMDEAFNYLRESWAPFAGDGSAELRLNRDGCISVASNGIHRFAGDAGAWHGMTHAWNIDVMTDGESLFDYLTSDRALALLRAVAQGLSGKSNGTSHVDRLSGSAEEAAEEVQADLDGLQTWKAVASSEVLGCASARDCFDGHSSFRAVVDALRDWAREEMQGIITDDDIVEELLGRVLDEYESGAAPTQLMRTALNRYGTAAQRETLAELDTRVDAGSVA